MHPREDKLIQIELRNMLINVYISEMLIWMKISVMLYMPLVHIYGNDLSLVKLLQIPHDDFRFKGQLINFTLSDRNQMVMDRQPG